MTLGRPAGTTAVPRRVLRQLAGSRATGALHLGGDPGGVFYLSAGRVSYAEAPGVPGVGELLTASGRLSTRTWQTTVDAGRVDCRVGHLLVEHGHLTRGELEQRIRTTIVQVARLLLHSIAVPVRFAPGEQHWLGPVTGVDMTALTRALARRRPGPVLPVPGGKRPPEGPLPATIGAGVSGDVGRLPRRRPGARVPGGDRVDAAVHVAPDEVLLTRIRSALKTLR